MLLNKTMMCGTLVVLAPGSPLQVFAAILIMQFHLLLVLKLAPYVKDSEDWSAFLSTLGLCLVSLGALMMMLDIKKEELQLINIVTSILPIVCIVAVLCIVIFVDCGLWHRLFKTRKKSRDGKDRNATRVVPTVVNSVDDPSDHTNNNTRIVPIVANDAIRQWN